MTAKRASGRPQLPSTRERNGVSPNSSVTRALRSRSRICCTSGALPPRGTASGPPRRDRCSGGQSTYPTTNSHGPMACSPLAQPNAASDVTVKLNATKTLSDRSPRAHAANGAASRTTRVGTVARSAVRSDTLPSSQRVAARLPKDDTTTSRCVPACTRLTISSSAEPLRSTSSTSAPWRRRRSASARRSSRTPGYFGMTLTCVSSSGTPRRCASTVATSAACLALAEKSVPQSSRAVCDGGRFRFADFILGLV